MFTNPQKKAFTQTVDAFFVIYLERRMEFLLGLAPFFKHGSCLWQKLPSSPLYMPQERWLRAAENM